MTTDQLLRTRRTVHNFEPRKVDLAIVREAVDSARWAPNHKLTEPWEFVLIGGETAAAISERNAEMLRETKGEARAAHKLARWRAIPNWMLLTCRRSDDAFREQEDYAACCCAAQNFMLSLWARGIGSKWGTGPVTRDSEFFKLVGINPAEQFVVGLFFFGYPADEPRSVRKPLGDVLRSLP
ncbi:MAG: nitroreductase [Rhodothermales bacterium]|nr:nitroreductase [Rhodothermales bacterium]MBO6780359.1 nitroreductase [Rhodothermales bacterium]